MIVIDEKYSFDGTYQDLVEHYSPDSDCICKLSMFEAPECYINAVYPNLEPM